MDLEQRSLAVAAAAAAVAGRKVGPLNKCLVKHVLLWYRWAACALHLPGTPKPAGLGGPGNCWPPEYPDIGTSLCESVLSAHRAAEGDQISGCCKYSCLAAESSGRLTLCRSNVSCLADAIRSERRLRDGRSSTPSDAHKFMRLLVLFFRHVKLKVCCPMACYYASVVPNRLLTSTQVRHQQAELGATEHLHQQAHMRATI